MTRPCESPPDRQVPPRQPPRLRSRARRSPPQGGQYWGNGRVMKSVNIKRYFGILLTYVRKSLRRGFFKTRGQVGFALGLEGDLLAQPAPLQSAAGRGLPSIQLQAPASPPLPGSLWLWTLTLAGDRLPGPVTLYLFSWCIRFTSAGSRVRARVWPGVPAPVRLHPANARQGSRGCAPPPRFLQK